MHFHVRDRKILQKRCPAGIWAVVRFYIETSKGDNPFTSSSSIDECEISSDPSRKIHCLLVREFAASQSEPAFAALVQRHIGLVHSAAMRQVGDAHLAEEIAQAVFIILARKATSLGPETILAAWLYRTTRYAAADALRTQRRRQAREQEAHMQSILTQPDADTWAQLAPLLDDAMAQLGETDRAALVLRFLENKTVPEIAGEMRVAEAAAQKRVTRALEKLRAIFVKQGVTLSAVALGGTIAANSVQAVPATLAATISAATMKGAAVAISVTTLVNGTIKTISMTTLQKTLVAATLVVAVGTGIYEAKQAAAMRAEVKTLQAQRAGPNQQLQNERDKATRQLAALRNENESLKRNQSELLRLRGEVARLRNESLKLSVLQTAATNDSMKTEMELWIARANKLKQRLKEWPEKQIPEFQFITPHDWIFSSLGINSELDSDYTNAVKSAQGLAKRRFADALHKSLQKFLADNNGKFPDNFSQLQSSFDLKIDSSIFQRYEITHAKLVNKLNPGGDSVSRVYEVNMADNTGEWVVVEKTPLYENDYQIIVSQKGVQHQPF
ncbi:MAG: sigma-70 family RNA polymerase sigma factor [Verrucomicrobiota bacterium]